MDIIETVEDQNKLIIRNSIKYLYNLTQAKQLNVPTLKSLYRTKCRLMELRRHIYLPQQKPWQRCQMCFMNFSEGNTKFEVRPAKLSSFAKKVISKAKNDGPLTSYQRNYYKKLLKKYPNGFHNQNKMALTCSYCNKEIQLTMNKPKKKASNNNVAPTKKKKKPKKKDKFCGLNVAPSITKKDDDDSNNKIPLHKSNLDTSVSMTNTRIFETSDFIPLDSKSRQKQVIRFTNKKEIAPPVPDVVRPGIAKSKEKLERKNLKGLSNILKKASGSRDRPTSKLKAFLASL